MTPGPYDTTSDPPFHKEARKEVLARCSSWPSMAEFLKEVEVWRLAMVQAAASRITKGGD